MVAVSACGFLLLVFCSLRPVSGAEEAAREVVLDEKSSSLTCGPRGLQFVLPPPATNLSFAVSVRDQAGLSHALQNDTDCRTWVVWRPDGSLVIGADYTGCYVSEQDEEYVMTLEITEIFSTQNVTLEKLLKCPVLLAMDAPSPVCAAVARVDRLLCGRLPINQTACQELDCCYDRTDGSTPCYFGNPVTAQCTAEGQATIAISADVVVPPLNLSSVRLLTVNSACPGLQSTQNQAFLLYEFPLSCSGVYKVDGDSTFYENRLEALNSVLTWKGASISRDSTFRLTVRCTFSSRTSGAFVPLQVEVFTLPPPLPVSSPGPLSLEMRLAKDQMYSSYYTTSEYPVLKILRDPIFVEVRLLQRTDPNLVLVLNECWATPSSKPMQKPQWPILVAGCPYAGDNYRTQVFKSAAFSMLQFPSHYQRFAVSTFTFVGDNQQNLRGQVFFHCSASVCVPSAQRSCSPSCPSRKKRMVEDLLTKDVNIVTEGPVYFVIQGGELAGSRSTSEESLVPGWARAAVFAVGFLVFFAVACLALVQFVRLWKHRSIRKCRMAVLT
ncbi:zona pellucida sperm-binding protein 4-like [Lissotriton helveticus]